MLFALRTAWSLKGVKQWVRRVLVHWIRELDAEVEQFYLCRYLLCSQDSTVLSHSINNGT